VTRPRVAAIISGVVASTAVFIVSTHWHLAGTLAGAAIVPVIYILVSHSATQGVEHVGKRVRQRRGQHVQGGERSAGAPAPEEEPTAGAGARGRDQWWLVGLASVALIVSIYALATSGDGKTIVHETVIRTVTTATGAKAGISRDKKTGSAATTTSTAAGKKPTSTTATTVGAGPSSTEPPATATTSGDASGDGASSTTDTTAATSTQAS
jgi:hypothetical protein